MDSLEDAFTEAEAAGQPRRLLIRPGAIGDFIVSLPALESLNTGWTEIWCASQNVPLARFAARALSIASSGLDRLGVLPADDVISRLRPFDDIVSWYGANRPDFRQLVGDLGLPFRFCSALPEKGAHAVEFYREQARGLGAAPDTRVPKISVPAPDRTFAVVHPFASSPRKQAPMDWFVAVAARLGVTMPVHWLAGPEDELTGAVRIDDLYKLACWLAGAKVFVGNDSGISHLAAAVGTPVLAAFSCGDMRVWSPRGLGWPVNFLENTPLESDFQ